MTIKERPILFSSPMVRAILEGRKTVTRRLVKPAGAVDVVPFIGRDNRPTGEFGWCPHPCYIERHIWCPYGQPGDRLWVRETFWKDESGVKPTLLLGAKEHIRIEYDADMKDHDREESRQSQYKCKPSIHMPRWASRITLEVIGVRVERLQDITRESAAAEGMCMDLDGTLPEWFRRDRWPEENFAALWDQINGDGAWHANPWVWVIEFKRVEAQTA